MVLVRPLSHLTLPLSASGVLYSSCWSYTFQRQTNGATLETRFSFSWKRSGGNGHFVSGYWSGEPVLDTTGTLHGCSQPTFLDVSDPAGEHFTRQPRGMGTVHAVPDFAPGYFASCHCNCPGHWVLSGATCRYTWNFAVPIPCCTLMCHGSTRHF